MIGRTLFHLFHSSPLKHQLGVSDEEPRADAEPNEGVPSTSYYLGVSLHLNDCLLLLNASHWCIVQSSACTALHDFVVFDWVTSAVKMSFCIRLEQEEVC